jgi:Ca2+-binding EF-hand superfamily protein
MRMRKPLSEAIKWYHEKEQFEDKKDIEHEILKSKVEQNINEYKSLGGRAYQVKILVTKAIDLIINGPARRIAPYFYYKFYKKGEHYSEVSEGNNPQFEDVATFNEIVNEDFLEYIQKNSLNIYIFDSMNNIELDVTEDEAKLTKTRQQISKDCIGICTIPLQGLLINDLIQGEFPIFNIDNQRVGKLIINIIWEEIKVGVNDKLLNSMAYRTEINQDTLLLKLANALKAKGLNVESAFNIFDIDQKNEISLENFKNTLLFTLKFSTNQNEIEHLIRIVFTNQGRTKLDKIEFYKIFSKLLPEPKMSQTYNNENLININNDTNNNLTNTNQNININTQTNNQNEISNYNQLTQNIQYMSINRKLDDINTSTSERDLNKIGQLVAIFKLKNGKMNFQAVDLFKFLFDKDASLAIDKKELAKGFADMNISLTEKELNSLWKKMSNGKESIDFDGFKQFHDNFCNLSVPNKEITETQSEAFRSPIPSEYQQG